MNKVDFNPNNIGIPNGNYFSFPFTPEEANVLLLPVPWDVTTSCGAGASKGPQAILDASPQLDFFDFDLEKAWLAGIGTLPVDVDILNNSKIYRAKAEDVIRHLENGNDPEDKFIKMEIESVNKAGADLNNSVYKKTSEWLNRNKLIGIVGGDHSVPLGFIQALSEIHNSFGILHIDAHADLRDAYEGFTFSHASIMFNAVKIPAVEKLVQVGIRDLCQDEMDIINADRRIILFDDFNLKEEEFQGKTWQKQCREIIKTLPDKVYISFDIDGLSPDLCPNTGTPVPGGLSFNQALYLLKSVVEAGKKIIGFDLTEVAPGKNDDWDANVGARLLYKLSNLMHLSSKK